MAKDNSTYLALNAIFQEVHNPKKYDKFEEYRKKNQKKSEIKSETSDRQVIDKREISDRQALDEAIDKCEISDRRALDEAIDGAIDEKQENTPYFDLVGNQKKFTLYIYNQCRNKGNLITDKIISSELIKQLNSTSLRLRNTISELKKKKIIDVINTKNGNGGWRIFRMKKDIYNEITKSLSDRRALDEAIDEAIDFRPCSSSYNYNNEITTTTELPPDWQSIDFCKLNEKIYFGINDLKNIYKAGKLTSAEFQQSIHGFAYRLENDEKFRKEIKNKKSYFMSTSLDGGSFHDPEKVEILKKQKEANEMMLQYQEQDRLRAIQERQKEENFRVWCDGLNPQKKDEILAKLSPDKNTFIHHKAALYNYYEANELES